MQEGWCGIFCREHHLGYSIPRHGAAASCRSGQGLQSDQDFRAPGAVKIQSECPLCRRAVWSQ